MIIMTMKEEGGRKEGGLHVHVCGRVRAYMHVYTCMYAYWHQIHTHSHTYMHTWLYRQFYWKEKPKHLITCGNSHADKIVGMCLALSLSMLLCRFLSRHLLQCALGHPSWPPFFSLALSSSLVQALFEHWQSIVIHLYTYAWAYPVRKHVRVNVHITKYICIYIYVSIHLYVCISTRIYVYVSLSIFVSICCIFEFHR
jgi:hypothetical protein